MIINQLLQHEGRVRDILPAGPVGPTDISGDNWSKSRAVLAGLWFEEILLAGKRIRPDFVECTFERGVFRKLKAKQHFWGASNLWRDCVFEDLVLDEVISPQNRFENCTFKNVTLKRYNPVDTLFLNCTFENVTFEALYVQPNRRNRMIRNRMAELWPYPEIAEMDKRRVSLLFRGCRFIKPVLTNCVLAHMSFEASEFIEPEGAGNRLEGLDGEIPAWLVAQQPTAPEGTYMEALNAMIDEKLGPQSWSKLRLTAFCQTYQGKHLESDWLDDLMKGGVPPQEYDVIEAIIDELESHFPPI